MSLFLLRLLMLVALGSGMGLALFFLEAGLAHYYAGYLLKPGMIYVAPYLVSGAACAVVCALVGQILWRQRGGFSAIRSGIEAFALLQVFAIFERSFRIAQLEGMDKFGASMVGVTLVLIYGFLMAILIRDRQPPGSLLLPLLCGVAVMIATAAARLVFYNPSSIGNGLVWVGCFGLLAVQILAVRMRAWRFLAFACLGTLGVSIIPLWASEVEGSADPNLAGVTGPSIMLVVVDTLRSDVFDAVVQGTPEGKAFSEAMGEAYWAESAIAAASWTAPSMGSILTGRHPQAHGLELDPSSPLHRGLKRLSGSVPTLAEELSDRGYFTQAVVTNELLHPRSGVARGFDSYQLLSGVTAYMPLLFFLESLGVVPAETYQNAESVNARMSRVIPALASRNQPFFFWLHLMDPHRPLEGHPSLPPLINDLSSGDTALYRDEVRFALLHLAQILDAFNEAGLGEDLIVVFTSDHGEMTVHDQRRYAWHADPDSVPRGHGHGLYDELIQIPFVIRGPGPAGGSASGAPLIHHVDIVPTVAGLLGVDLSEVSLDGSSLGYIFDGGDPDEAVGGTALSGSMMEGPEQRSLRTLEYKLIDFPDHPEWTEFYDLSRDPGETENLASHEAERVARAQAELGAVLSGIDEAGDTGFQDIDAATARRLEALGYVE